MIKKHELAFVKTSQEPVFVLDITAEQAIVRRPVAGQDGVRHSTDEFLLVELETLEEQRARFRAEQEDMVRRYGPKPSLEDSETKSFLA